MPPKILLVDGSVIQRRASMFRGKFLINAFVITVALTALASSLEAQVRQNRSGTDTARLLAALERSGHKYRKTDEKTWLVSMIGNNIKDMPVAVTLADDYVLVQVRLAPRKDVNVKDPLLVKMLELNDEIDAAKLALSKDWVYARAEMHAKLVGEKEIDYLIRQVAAVADEIYPHIEQALNRK
jgi:hypothetical protein